MYECVICHSLASLARAHCPTCGTIPANYSMLGKPARMTENGLIEVVSARGAIRSGQHRTVRAELKTVELDYYASE